MTAGLQILPFWGGLKTHFQVNCLSGFVFGFASEFNDPFFLALVGIQALLHAIIIKVCLQHEAQNCTILELHTV